MAPPSSALCLTLRALLPSPRLQTAESVVFIPEGALKRFKAAAAAAQQQQQQQQQQQRQ